MRTNSAFVVCATAICLGAAASLAQADAFPENYIGRALHEASKPVTVDIAHLAEGEVLSVQYIGRPVYVYRRTPSDIARLIEQSGSELQDPNNEDFREAVRHEFGSTSSAVWARLLLAGKADAMAVPTRSRSKEIFVVGGWGPGSGCRLVPANRGDRPAAGVVFSDPCTGAAFDAAGRLFSRVTVPTDSPPAVFNLAIPPYRIEGDRVIIGLLAGQALPPLPFSKAELCPENSPNQRLICAARYNDIESVREALGAGADANYYRPGAGSPIDAAIIGSSLEVIELLLKHGAKPTPNSDKAAQFVQREDVLALLHGGKP